MSSKKDRSVERPLSASLDSEKLDLREATRATHGSPTNPASLHPLHIEEAYNRTIISFEENDKLNPYNWSRPKKLYCAAVSMAMVLNSAMGSSLPSGAANKLETYFGIHDQARLVLPVSIYLIGYMLGPLIFAPLSESYGRKIVMTGTFLLFTAFILGCALAPSYAAFIVFRFLAGIGASTPMSVIGGILADLYSTPHARGAAVVWFMGSATWGPVAGPILSGYVSEQYSWQWVFWVELIIAGATWPFILLMPETYGPVILSRKASKLRQQTGDETIFAPADVEDRGLWETVTVVLTRPVRMLLFEAIVLFSCLYLSLAYGIFYGFFQAFGPIFGGLYNFTPGEIGLCFLPMGLGSFVAAINYFWWDRFFCKAQCKEAPPSWVRKEEYFRLPLACVGGPLIVVSIFWLGWTARPDIHWAVPVVSTVLFGWGFLLIFLALTNYIVDAYETFAASALAAISTSRSIAGGVIPFAAKPMFSTLGISWACTLLAILSLVLCVVPFVFLKYGAKIRARSKFCQELKRQREGSR